MILLSCTMSVKTRRKSKRIRRPSPPPTPKKQSSDLVSVVGAGNDGSKQKTRIRKGNTNKLVSILQDQLEFVPFKDPALHSNYVKPQCQSEQVTQQQATIESTEKNSEDRLHKSRSVYRTPYPRSRARQKSHVEDVLNDFGQIIKEKRLVFI